MLFEQAVEHGPMGSDSDDEYLSEDLEDLSVAAVATSGSSSSSSSSAAAKKNDKKGKKRVVLYCGHEIRLHYDRYCMRSILLSLHSVLQIGMWS